MFGTASIFSVWACVLCSLLNVLPSAVNCGILNNPSNGQVRFDTTTFQSQATYNCSAGYILNGNMTRTCEAERQWSGDEPSCERKNMRLCLFKQTMP